MYTPDLHAIMGVDAILVNIHFGQRIHFESQCDVTVVMSGKGQGI